MGHTAPFHFPPSFFNYSSIANLDIKLSIIQAIAQEPSLKKTYPIENFLNQYSHRRHTLQAKIKKEILNEFQKLLKYKMIEPIFEFQTKDGQNIGFQKKDNIQLQDIQSSEFMYFYEII